MHTSKLNTSSVKFKNLNERVKTLYQDFFKVLYGNTLQIKNVASFAANELQYKHIEKKYAYIHKMFGSHRLNFTGLSVKKPFD